MIILDPDYPAGDALKWGADKLGIEGWRSDSVPLAITDGDGGPLVAVIVFNTRFLTQCLIHIASDGTRRWASPRILQGIFYVAFIAGGLRRLTAFVEYDNLPALQLLWKVGFQFEGRQRRASDRGKDLVMAGMLIEECPWLQREGDQSDG